MLRLVLLLLIFQDCFMKKPLAAFAALALSTCVCAQTAFQAPLVEQSLLLDIAAAKHLVMVGERGHILLSDDGQQFTQAVVPTTATLTATTIVGDNIWAVGHDATILHSADAGKTWQVQLSKPKIERPFLDVHFFDSRHGIAVGAYGMFYRTEDGGEHWRSELHAALLDPYDREYLEQLREEDEDFYNQELGSILPHLNRLSAANGRLYLAGEAGTLAVSDDEGKTWQRFEVDYAGSFFDIAPLDNNTMMAVGLRGNIFVMRTPGEWEYVKTCSTSTLNSIMVLSDTKVAALGNNGMIVTLQRPLPVSEPDPYANPAQCTAAEGIDVTQIKDKAAIVNAITFNNQILAVSANGIKQLNLK